MESLSRKKSHTWYTVLRLQLQPLPNPVSRMGINTVWMWNSEKNYFQNVSYQPVKTEPIKDCYKLYIRYRKDGASHSFWPTSTLVFTHWHHPLVLQIFAQIFHQSIIQFLFDNTFTLTTQSLQEVSKVLSQGTSKIDSRG